MLYLYHELQHVREMELLFHYNEAMKNGSAVFVSIKKQVEVLKSRMELMLKKNYAVLMEEVQKQQNLLISW